MTQAKLGDTVKVHYTGKLIDGRQFDSSVNAEPLEFTLGEGMVIPGFEEAVVGMTPGENKTTEIPANQAYGPYHEERNLVIKREAFPSHIKPEVGQYLRMHQAEGSVDVVVSQVSEVDITLDANHPLAGKDLIFDIQLVEIG